MAKLSVFDTRIAPHLERIKAERINGASLGDIAKMLGVANSTLSKWMDKYDELYEVMKEATTQLHAKIEVQAQHSLLDKLQDRMMVTEQILEDGVITKEKRQLVKADTTAIIFALKARNPEKWEPLGVARLKEEDKQDDLNTQILDALNKYKSEE